MSEPPRGRGTAGREELETAETMTPLPEAATLAADSDGTAPTISSDTAMAATATPATSSSLGPAPVDLSATPLEERGYEARYERDRELGRGGMGEIHLCKDERVGRAVAMKRMRAGTTANADAVARFVREARVQGQLEHPAIVPVYDIGLAPDGTPYFTMKRLRGLTLETILAGLRNGDDAIAATYSQRKLLTTFSQVCQAIDFAHRHGVLHRDLKPGNIMLGDFGEVYVLDWGLARIAGTDDDASASSSSLSVRTGTDSIDGAHTAHGAIMGTPGYMAPEQLRGDVELLDARADVYSLGAILFEVLTLQPLHERVSPKSMIESTLKGADARASVRCPDVDVAPELESLCVAATAIVASERFPSAGALVAQLERYLDGDRDLARRRELAAEHAREAEEIMTGRLDTEARRRALRAAGHAVALDPDSVAAVRVLARLMLEPPTEDPPEVVAAMEASNQATSRKEAAGGLYSYGAYAAAIAATLTLGLKSWTIFGVALGLCAVLAYTSVWFSRVAVMKRWHVLGACALNSALIFVTARMFGPYVLVPGIATVSTIAFLFHGKLQRPAVTVSLGVLPIVATVVLEWVGVLPSTYSFEHGVMVVHSTVVDMPAVATNLALTTVSVGIIVTASIYIQHLRAQLVSSEHAAQLQAWQLRQMIPEEPRQQA